MAMFSRFEDSTDGDLIIRCGDEYEFYAYNLIILAKASSVFRDMLAMPAPPQTGQSVTHTAVEATEAGQTVQWLLQFAYPEEDPVLDDVQAVHSVLKACDEYQMGVVGKRVG